MKTSLAGILERIATTMSSITRVCRERSITCEASTGKRVTIQDLESWWVICWPMTRLRSMKTVSFATISWPSAWLSCICQASSTRRSTCTYASCSTIIVEHWPTSKTTPTPTCSREATSQTKSAISSYRGLRLSWVRAQQTLINSS